MGILAMLLGLLLCGGQVPAGVWEDFGPGWEARWQTQQLGGWETRYRVERDGEEWVLRVDSEASATALYRVVAGPPEAASVAWRWRVERSLAAGEDEKERGGDDYAARLFVIFGDGELRSDTRALCYVWAGSMPVGSSYRSPVVDGVHTVVLQSGDDRAGEWAIEKRDFAADYRRAFGAEPGPVGAIAVMVDTDDTGLRATAWYDDIVIR